MWTAPVPIFDDEDEEKLIADFVEMSARYPKYSPFEICEHIFKDLRDPSLRASQAALQWSKDLTILERIRQARLNGGAEAKPVDSKEEKLRKLEAIYNDPEVSAKDRLGAIQLHAQIEGQIIKAVEKKTEDRTRHFPQIIHGVYPDA